MFNRHATGVFFKPFRDSKGLKMPSEQMTAEEGLIKCASTSGKSSTNFNHLTCFADHVEHNSKEHSTVSKKTMNRVVAAFESPDYSEFGTGVSTFSNDDKILNTACVRKRTEPIFCYLCNIPCTSEIVMQQHLVGKKHQAKLADFKQGEVEAYDNTQEADIQRFIDTLDSIDCIVGLQYVTEYRRVGLPNRYFCELCNYKCDMKEMLDHLILRRHKLRFLRAHVIRAYCRITGYPSFKNIMLPDEANKFISNICSRIAIADRERGIVKCKVEPFISESLIVPDINGYCMLERVHPSTYKDPDIAEEAFQEMEASFRRVHGSRSTNQSSRNAAPSQTPLQRINLGQNEEAKVVYQTPSNLLINNNVSSFDKFENPAGSSSSGFEKKEQNILKVPRESVVRTNEFGDTNFEKRERFELQRDLKKIHENIHLDTCTTSSKQDQTSMKLSPNPHLKVFDNFQVTISKHSPSKRKHSETDLVPESSTSSSNTKRVRQPSEQIDDIRKVVEPIIADTRRRVEEKIYEALSSGNLPSIINALKNNPALRTIIEQWEKSQKS